MSNHLTSGLTVSDIIDRELTVLLPDLMGENAPTITTAMKTIVDTNITTYMTELGKLLGGLAA